MGKKPASALNTSLDLVQTYTVAGLCCIPVKTDGSKTPAITQWKGEIWAFFSGHQHGIAIMCSVISRDLEVLDFDAPEIVDEWRELVGEAAPDRLKRLPQRQTPSLGLHVFYRCAPLAGNQKLAIRLEADEKLHILIETRGERGYVITVSSPLACHPTGNPYQLIRGDLWAIPTISTADGTFCCVERTPSISTSKPHSALLPNTSPKPMA